MLYGLIFTIYSLIFMFINLITVLFKVKSNLLRHKLYSALIYSSMLFAIVEIFGILGLGILKSQSVFAFFWQFRNVVIFLYAFVFVCYYYTLMKKIDCHTFIELLKKSLVIKILLIVFIALPIFYIVCFDIKEMDINNMQYVRGLVAYIILFSGIVFCISSLFVLYKNKRENKNIIITVYLFMFVFAIACPLQIFIPYISFMPFVTSLFAYVLYYNIENPDIELLQSVSLLKLDIDNSSNTKTDFLFNMSYDLINPINTIVSLSDSICSMNTFDKNSVVVDAENIKLIGNTLLDSIDNIFEMSNDNGSSEKEYNLYDLISRMRSVSETRIGSKQVKFEMNIDNNLSAKYIGDINKIQKFLLNILGNSVKFTDVGKIVLNLNFDVDKEKHVLHFKITDTGCGIKDEEKSFIFSDSEVDKSGVGLAISKKYIEDMGGTIRFDSVYGGGTTFYIDLPQKVSGTNLISDDMSDNIKSDIIEYNDLSMYKVLIVDDDSLDIKVTKRLLEKYNINLDVCMSCIEFIDRIKNEEEFNLVFLDHKMSELDGVEAIKLIRQLEGYKLPYIVALTANASSGARDYYKSVGFDDYLAKPIDKFELDGILKKIKR